MAFLSPLCQTTQEGKKKRERGKKERAMHNLLCMTDKGSEYRHLSAPLFTSPNRFSDVSICQGPNENMMRRIYGPWGRMEGWEGRGGEGRNGTRDGCRGRMKGEKIHSVLISGLRRGYIVLGAFYLDVAAAGVCLSLLFHSLSLSLPSSFSLCICVCLTRINVFIFLFISSFSHLNSHRLPLPPSAFQERCNFFLIILMLPVLPPLFSICARLSVFSCSCVEKYVFVFSCCR